MSKFDMAALTWDEKPMRVNIAKAVADGIKRQIKLGQDFKVLDFGCGTGLVSFFISDSVKKIVGLDSSKGMVEVFNQKAKENNINAVAYQIDLFNQDFEDKDFNLIVSSMVFHHIKDVVQMLSRLSNHLVDGGYIAVADLLKEDGTFHDDNEGVEHFGFEIEEFKLYLKDAGFDDVKGEIVFELEKEKNGQKRKYPVFLISGRKRAV